MMRRIDPKLAISGQPSAEDLQKTAQQGYSKVVNVRADPLAEEAGQAARTNLAYTSLPVRECDLTEATLRRFEEEVSASQGPVLVHCDTGFGAALLAFIHLGRREGWSPRQLFERARAEGFDFEADQGLASFVEKSLGG